MPTRQNTHDAHLASNIFKNPFFGECYATNVVIRKLTLQSAILVLFTETSKNSRTFEMYRCIPV